MALDIAALESSLSGWETAGYITTGVVVLGVLGESIVEFTGCIKARWLRKKVGMASALILIVGLAGEILTQIRVNAISGQIIAFLNDEAAEAKLEIARLTTERKLSPVQFNELVKALRPYMRWRYWVSVERSDPDLSSEQSIFGAQMASVFESAGWRRDNHLTPSDPNKAEDETRPVSDRGCNLAFHPAARPTADIILSHLHEAGIDCVWHLWPDLAQDAIILEVGLR